MGDNAFDDLVNKLSRAVSPEAVHAAFGAALISCSSEVVRQAVRIKVHEEEERVRLAAIAGMRTDWLERWLEEAARRQKTCRMTRGASIRSVYEDVIAGRMT